MGNLNSMKLDKKRLSYMLIIILILAGVVGFAYYQNTPKEITRYNFYGTDLQFRTDLRSANSVSVYPDKESILNKVWDPEITRIHIVYVVTSNTSEENSLIALNAFEVRYKLDVAYQNPKFNWVNEFTSEELQSFENISQANNTLVIALVIPSLSDKTAVEMDGNIVYIKGQTARDFDLATIKFLMSALNITV